MSDIEFGFNAYKTDDALESKGIWLNYGKDGKFLVARAGGANKRFTKRMEAATRPYRRQLEAGTFNDNDLLEKVLAEVFAETVILGWEGITNKKTGEDVPFTKENCIRLLKAIPNLFADLREQAASMANFRQEGLEEDAKN